MNKVVGFRSLAALRASDRLFVPVASFHLGKEMSGYVSAFPRLEISPHFHVRKCSRHVQMCPSYCFSDCLRCDHSAGWCMVVSLCDPAKHRGAVNLEHLGFSLVEFYINYFVLRALYVVHFLLHQLRSTYLTATTCSGDFVF
jgi:hypothetical protein